MRQFAHTHTIVQYNVLPATSTFSMLVEVDVACVKWVSERERERQDEPPIQQWCQAMWRNAMRWDSMPLCVRVYLISQGEKVVKRTTTHKWLENDFSPVRWLLLWASKNMIDVRKCARVALNHTKNTIKPNDWHGRFEIDSVVYIHSLRFCSVFSARIQLGSVSFGLCELNFHWIQNSLHFISSLVYFAFTS